jgi:hypothetical protein
MKVIYLPEADRELQALENKAPREIVAIDTAVHKLQELGLSLRYPHCSHVQEVANLWELRPRAGKSAWRAFYRRIGAEMVIGAIGPDAKVDRTGFRWTVAQAVARLDAYALEEG